MTEVYQNIEYKNFLGIDPGKNGGLVVLRGNGKIYTQKMPETAKDILLFVRIHSVNTVAVLEKVHSMPRNGGKAMFTFGQGYGMLQMALLAAKVPFHEVPPQTWMKHYQLGKKKESASDTEWKNKLKNQAQKLFPNVKVTLWNADALLIAYYCQKVHGKPI